MAVLPLSALHTSCFSDSASAQKSPPLHADMPVFACVLRICKYLAAASHPLLTPSWVYINVMDSPETRRHLHICKMSHWMGAFWNKTSHPLHILNTAGLARECCRSWRCSSRWGPSLHEVLHVALGSRVLRGAWWCWRKLCIVLTYFFILNSWLSSTSKLLLILQLIENNTGDDSDCIVLRGDI